ncbi:hypothetical protein BC833DRAFT_601030 [Globomyces pollinis-pini]|nr:hypothetical protein BC833DRAFT_601030 [Globomyces pollinis-pini]
MQQNYIQSGIINSTMIAYCYLCVGKGTIWKVLLLLAVLEGLRSWSYAVSGSLGLEITSCSPVGYYFILTQQPLWSMAETVQVEYSRQKYLALEHRKDRIPKHLHYFFYFGYFCSISLGFATAGAQIASCYSSTSYKDYIDGLKTLVVAILEVVVAYYLISTGIRLRSEAPSTQSYQDFFIDFIKSSVFRLLIQVPMYLIFSFIALYTNVAPRGKVKHSDFDKYNIQGFFDSYKHYMPLLLLVDTFLTGLAVKKMKTSNVVRTELKTNKKEEDEELSETKKGTKI